MSTYKQLTKHPETGKWEMATWIDDFYSHHHYGVKFLDGKMYDPERMKLEIKDIDEKEVTKKEEDKSQIKT